MQLSIIGTGHVGLVTGACFAEYGNQVVCVDNDVRKIETLRGRKMPIYEPGLEELVLKHVDAGKLRFSTEIRDAVRDAEVIFICVGTPQLPSGAPDLSYIEAVSREIARHLEEYRIIVEKSTVPVQTGQRVKMTISKYVKKDVPFDVASNPEFLREGSAISDTLHPERVVIGVESKRAEDLLRRIYEPFNSTFVVTDIHSAELIKHASNAFLALKISFINSVANVCEATGADVEEVARGMGLDTRIGKGFLRAGIGYGGYCFPKDVEALIRIAHDLRYDFGILREVQNVNVDQRIRFVNRIEKELWVLKDKTIGLLGLSFKPNTDDIRESPAIEVGRELLRRGAKVKAYDPQAIPHVQRDAKISEQLKGVVFCKDAYEAAADADCLALVTEWDEFRKLDFERIKSTMSHPTILDGRNFFDPAALKRLGFTYHSVGRA
ncbi:MAG: UDP-glucose/GDP-mannose dehydrogenase family protein [Planctomycetes bacterium]|nr:UDP-glucose/GDP-mannose dehydrogenase family protein [Planctomycetota bacterium]